MRFRLLLPTLSVLLAVVLFRMGDIQAENILNVRRHGGFVEPVPDTYARARYLHYALNAPAWASLGEERGMLWSPSTDWTGRNFRYVLAVIAMWYLLGFHLDMKLSAKKTRGAPQKTYQGRIFALMYALYGLFLCRSMLPEFTPLRSYGYWLPLRKYEPWFIAAVILWGMGMTLAGSYSLYRRSGPGTATAGPV